MLQSEPGGCASVEDGPEKRWTLMLLEGQTFTITIQALRRMLKAPTEEVFRTALRVLAHYVRLLGPHCESWKLWPRKDGLIGRIWTYDDI